MGKKKGKTGGGDDKKGDPAHPQPKKEQPTPSQQTKKDQKPTAGPSGDAGTQQEKKHSAVQDTANQQAGGSKVTQQRQQQQPEIRQPQGAWAVKGQEQQKPKSQEQQRQDESRQPQSAWGAKATQQQSEIRQPQGAWAAKGSDQQKQQQSQGGKQQQPQGRQHQQQPQGRQQQQQQLEGRQQQQQQPQGRQQQQQQPAQGRQQQQQQQQPQGRQQQQQQPAQGRQQQQQQQQQPQGRQQQQQQQQPQGRQQQSQGRQQQQQPHGRQQQQGRDQAQHPQPGQTDVQRQISSPSPSLSISSLSSALSDITTKSTATDKSAASSSTLSQRSDVSLARGTRGRPMVVETNYLELILDKMQDYAYQYDIKIEPDKPKRFMRFAFIAYCKAVKIPNGALAFDGKANVFSPRQLGPQFVQTCEVKVLDPESGQEKLFKVTLMETQYSAIELKTLKTYQRDRIFDKPMRALQCLDVILSSPCHQKGTRGGRSFYNPPSDGKRIDLSESYELWLGLFQAAVLGERPFLNIDISHRAFPSAVHLTDVIQSLAGRNGHNLNESLPTFLSNSLYDYLRGLVVIYTPPQSFNSIPKRFKFQNIKMSSNRQEFTIDNGRKLTVAQYYQEKGCPLRYPNLPCIHVGNTIKTNYIPIEFCEIAAGQLNLKKAGPRQVSAMIRHAATSTDVRKDKILRQFHYMDHNRHPTLSHFGVSVGQQFLKVDARVLNAPTLEYKQQKIEPRNGSWNGSDYIQPATLHEWAILNLDDRTHENDARKFGQMIAMHGTKLKMNISDRFAMVKSRDDRLEGELRKFKQDNKSIVFVIISNRQNSYSKVKQNAEIQFGVLTQCIKPDTIYKRLNPATIQNILLKVNAKLNGLNHRIHEQAATVIMKNKNVMFIGADVTHPTPDQRTIPSVVGVVASHDVDGFQYNMRWCLQEPTKEIIVHMQDITLHHLNVYEKKNKKLPEVIIYYRDGVSEGQFPDITNVELRAMDAAFSKKSPNYRPKLTCLIVQKRHHTRFFPQARQGVGKFNNVPPGTCVDQTITHPNECQFFLVSHESIQGTAKPTKYCVLRDDSHFSIDDLQAITYNMCHMFARCNRSVSYPAPAYYAHHSASRGKIYIEGQNLNMKDLQKETMKREIKNDIIGLHPMFFV